MIRNVEIVEGLHNNFFIRRSLFGFFMEYYDISDECWTYHKYCSCRISTIERAREILEFAKNGDNVVE